MEIAILVLLSILVLLVIILILLVLKNKKDEISIVEKLGRFEFNITKEINYFKNDLEL